MSHIVLVHGSWHGGWCWESLTPHLEQCGHVVHAIDLPGMGADTTPLASVTISSWSVWLAALLERLPEPAILVGHSRGGAVISCVAEQSPERVAKLIYLSAFLLPDGKSCFDLFLSEIPPQAVLDNPDLIQLSGDGTSTLDKEGARACLYSLCPSDVSRAAADRLGPEPQWVLEEPVRITDARFGTVPRAYVETTQDQTLAIGLQRKMHASLPCSEVVSLDADHSPFLSSPAELAKVIDDLARAGRT